MGILHVVAQLPGFGHEMVAPAHLLPGGDERFSGSDDGEAAMTSNKRPRSGNDLRNDLLRIDGRPYPAYNDVTGGVVFDMGDFSIGCVQGQSDPFAPPSRRPLRAGFSRTGE